MNDQQRAAMQMALEALQILLTCKHGEFCDHYRDAENQSKKAITALREALAQPQENTARCGGCNKTADDGWALYCVECWEKAQPQDHSEQHLNMVQGEWVDLTVDEIAKALNTADSHNTIDSYRSVIAKFKEKNTPPVMPQSDFAAKIIAKALHYPECWDTAAYPTLDDAVIEAEVWDCYGCSVCKPQNHSGEATDMVQGEWVDLTDDEVEDLATNWFAEEWAVDKAKGLIDDFLAKFKERNTPPVVPQGEPVAWHHPECEGSCLACLIEKDVQENFGNQGLNYLQRHIHTTPPSVEAWIDPNDKTQALYLPHIGEPVLFCHDGVTYYGKHTGGSFRTGVGVTARDFDTWGCYWMYLPAAAIRSMK